MKRRITPGGLYIALMAFLFVMWLPLFVIGDEAYRGWGLAAAVAVVAFALGQKDERHKAKAAVKQEARRITESVMRHREERRRGEDTPETS